MGLPDEQPRGRNSFREIDNRDEGEGHVNSSPLIQGFSCCSEHSRASCAHSVMQQHGRHLRETID